jgi:hypothetical protein
VLLGLDEQVALLVVALNLIRGKGKHDSSPQLAVGSIVYVERCERQRQLGSMFSRLFAPPSSPSLLSLQHGCHVCMHKVVVGIRKPLLLYPCQRRVVGQSGSSADVYRGGSADARRSMRRLLRTAPHYSVPTILHVVLDFVEAGRSSTAV